MRQKSVSGSSLSLLTPASVHSPMRTPMRTPMRAYVACCTIIIGYLLCRFLLIAETVHFAAPEIAPESAKQQRQPCWHSDLNATAGAAPCHDPDVPVPEGNAKVYFFAPLLVPRVSTFHVSRLPCCCSFPPAAIKLNPQPPVVFVSDV